MFCETMCGKLFCVFFLSFFFQQHSNEGLRHKKHKNTAQNTRIELRNQCFQFPHIQSRSEGPGCVVLLCCVLCCVVLCVVCCVVVFVLVFVFFVSEPLV